MTIYNEEYFQNLYESLLNIYIEDKLEMETMNEDFFLLTEDPILLETRKTAMKKTKAKRKLKKAILAQKRGQATQADVDAAELNFVKQQSEAKAKEDYYKGKKAQREIKIARRQPEDGKNPTRYYSAKKAYTDAEKKGNFDLVDHINNKNIAQTVQKARKYREIKETGGIDKHVKDVQNAAVNKLAYQKAKDSNRKEEIAKTIAAIDKKADKDSAAIIASSEKSGSLVPKTSSEKSGSLVPKTSLEKSKTNGATDNANNKSASSPSENVKTNSEQSAKKDETNIPKNTTQSRNSGSINAASQRNPETSKPSSKLKAKLSGKRIAGRVGTTALTASGAATIAVSASKYSKFKKDAPNLYKHYQSTGGTKDYKTWFKEQSRKYKAGIIGGSVATAGGIASHIGMSLNKKKKAINDSLDFFNYLVELDEAFYEGYYETEATLNILDEAYYEGYYGVETINECLEMF